MAIELTCTQCYANLLVTDEAAGAQAQCPHCNEVFDVDSSTANLSTQSESTELNETLPYEGIPGDLSGSSPLPDERLSRDVNPYATPNFEELRSENGDAVHPKMPMELGRLNARMALALAWELFTGNFAVLILVHGSVLMIALFISSLALPFQSQGKRALYLLVQYGIGQPVQWFLTIGIATICLSIARGNRTIVFSDIFSGGRYFLRVVGYMLLYIVMVVLGTCLFVLPGVYLACRYWPGFYFIVDRDVGVFEAMELSSAFTDGNRIQAVFVGAIGFALILVTIPTLGLALFVTLPLYSMLWAIAFLMITRQPIQRGRAN